MQLKKLFLLLAIIGLVFFITPEVLSLFTGQHLFYNDVNSKCGKCHPDTDAQLMQTAIHATLTCTNCHNVSFNQTKEGHAAVVIRCLDCHGENGSYVMDKNNVSLYAPPAVAFSLPDMGESTPEAHVAFVKNNTDTNNACLYCHTNTALKIQFIRPLYSQFYARQQTQSFTLTSAGAPNYTDITTAGAPKSSVSHLFIPVSDISCTRCHQDVWSAINRPTASNGSARWSQSGHVAWLWTAPNATREAKIHDPGYIGSAYSTTSEYCLWSCHRALVSSTPNGSSDVAPFNQQVHAALRVSCYYCHNGSATGYGPPRYVFSKPDNSWVQVVYPNASHGNLWKNIETSPLWVHADACVACKRDSNYAGGGGNFTVYTEPNTVVIKSP